MSFKLTVRLVSYVSNKEVILTRVVTIFNEIIIFFKNRCYNKTHADHVD